MGKVKSAVQVEETAACCYWCHGNDLWRTPRGNIFCRRCHPPVAGVKAISRGETDETTE